MLTSNFGFCVTNYVGHYNIDILDGKRMIVSNEFRNAREDEQSLKKRNIFLDDFQKENYILMNLAAVDVKNETSILEFCNNYGLPISSALIADLNPGYFIMGIDCTETQYAQFDPFYRQDKMSVNEFLTHVYRSRHLLSLKNEIEIDPSKRNPKNLFESLMPLLFYERRWLYDFDGYDEVETVTPTARFRDFVLNNSLGKLKTKKTHFTRDVHYFFLAIKNLNTRSNIDEQLIQDLKSDYWEKLYKMLIEFTKLPTKMLNDIVTDEYDNVILANDFKFSPALIASMYEVAPTILSDIINEGLYSVHPNMRINENTGKFAVDWQITYLYEGVLVELMILIAADMHFQKCANPTCNKFFLANLGYNDRIYCSHRCGVLVAKRKQRKLDKENPNRERNPAKFQGRKKHSQYPSQE